jgi:protoheme IX farnesyltransferase
MEKSVTLEKPSFVMSKVQDYAQLTKMRLASLVVFSAGIAFLLAPGDVDLFKLLMLVLGGFLVTGSANGYNQVIERELDKLMTRTMTRPLPDQRMSVAEALLVCTILGVAGVFILTYFMNLTSGILGLLAILLYTLVYTPLKRKTPFAVFVGAIPGAIPPMLGWVAATGNLGLEAWMLFTIQFLWQFPHFWAIAWVMDEDYKKAGFNLLPTGERDKGSALQALIYTLSLIPVGIMPFVFHLSGWMSMVVVLMVTLFFLQRALQLYRKCDIESARKLMYGSFIYLPVVLIALLLDKI